MKQLTNLRILIVDDEEIVHETLGDYLKQMGHEVVHSYDGNDAHSLIDQEEYDLAMFDVRMPGYDGLELLEKVQEMRPTLSVVIMTGHGTMETAIAALRLGAADFLTKPMKLQEIDAIVAKALRLRELRTDRIRLKDTIRFIQQHPSENTPSTSMIGESTETADVRRQIERAVKLGVDTILISGETGTGKEVVAREIHATAGSDDSPFIAVSCPALPETLVESELFGHVKGSFTGANEDRTGCFELASGGTLFLDEIADLSANAQAKILRALETRTVRKVGGARETAVDTRIVAATNVPLEDLVTKKRFRQDLYYRLNVFNINLLPLRQRPGDIMPLARHFLDKFASSRNLSYKGFTDEAQRAILAYPFPGNARELRNVVERAAVLCGGGLIELVDLDLMDREPSTAPEVFIANGSDDTGDDSARIRAALEQARWNRKEAARILNMPYSTLRYKIQKYRIE